MHVAAESAHNFISFIAGNDQLLALPLAEISEVLPMALLTKPPGKPPILEGFLNLAGDAWAVVNLSAVLGLPPEIPGVYSALLAMRGPERTAFLVKRVLGIVTVGSGDLLPAIGAASFNDCASTSFVVDGRPVHLLTYAKVLLLKEKLVVDCFRRQEQARMASAGDIPA